MKLTLEKRVTKDKHVTFRTTKEDYETIERIGKAYNLSNSEVIYQAVNLFLKNFDWTEVNQIEKHEEFDLYLKLVDKVGIEEAGKISTKNAEKEFRHLLQFPEDERFYIAVAWHSSSACETELHTKARKVFDLDEIHKVLYFEGEEGLRKKLEQHEQSGGKLSCSCFNKT
jgi:hypothetical protein